MSIAINLLNFPRVSKEIRETIDCDAIFSQYRNNLAHDHHKKVTYLNPTPS